MSTGGKPIAPALRGQIALLAPIRLFGGIVPPESRVPSSGPDEVDQMDGRARGGQPLLVAINIAPIRLVMGDRAMAAGLLSG
jgi:hypothetical protein